MSWEICVLSNKSPGLKKKHFAAVVLMIMLACTLFLILTSQSVIGQANETLAAQYTPVLHFTKGEKFYPTTVEYLISSSVLKDRDTGATVDSAPSVENLGSHTSGNLFLDNKRETLTAIAEDYASNPASNSYTAYVHVTNSGGSTVIQYWLFYAYNNGPLNEHQGDLEVIEVFLDSSGSAQTLLLSQHGAGENARWADVEKTNGHPVVYVAEGSHANYFRSFQGKMGIENDNVGNDGKTISAESLQLVMLGEANNHPASQNWLTFSGRWGYWGTEQEVALGRAGPYGPIFNQEGIRWAQPEAYKQSTFVVDSNYFILAWLVANFLLLFLIYIVVRVVWKSRGIYKSHKAGGLKTRKMFSGRGGAGLAIAIAAIIVTTVALFLPWYTITGSSATKLLASNNAPLMSIDGVHGVQVNMFLGTNSDSASGFSPLLSAQLPFMIIFLAGLLLLALDIIGITSRRKFARKLWLGIISTLLPVIFVLVFVALLPSFLPLASGLAPNGGIPPQVGTLTRTMASNPIGGKSDIGFPLVGAITVTWGLAIGAILLIVGAILRLVAGLVMYGEPKEKPKPPVQVYVERPVPPPPPPT
jgi:hypothetical protein